MNPTDGRISNLLASELADFRQESEAHGRCRLQSQPVNWRLAPQGPGFYLVLEGRGTKPGRAQPSALATTALLPWPLKGARRKPGGAVHWQAEVYLCGCASDRPRLTSLLGTLSGWLRPANAAKRATAVARDWPSQVAEATGAELDCAAADRYRLHMPGGTAIEWIELEDELQVRSLLLRRGERGARSTAIALDDLLSVANARQHGSRAVFANHDDALEAWVEARLLWDTLTADAIRRALAAVADSAARLARSCDALCEHDLFAAEYQHHLLGQADTAVVC